MTDLERISRSIDQLREASTGWDWTSFVSTFVATLVGAALAAAVAFLVLRRERADQYQERMLAAARSTVDALIEYGNQISRNVAEQATDDRRVEEMLTAISVTTELMLLDATCNERDRLVVRELHAAQANVVIDAPPLLRSNVAATISGLVARLAAGHDDHQVLLKEARELRTSPTTAG